jgi:hypothetical protein
MPSRAVEAAFLTAVGIAVTALAFTLLRPYLFPQKAIKLEMIKDNVESLASILDKGGGKFSPKTAYALRSKGALLRVSITVYPSRQAKVYILPLPVVSTSIGEMRTLILRGDPSPYANATKSAFVSINGNAVEVIERPAIHIENCEYYGFSCKFIRITLTRLILEHAGKTTDTCTLTEGTTIDVFLNRSMCLPAELNYGKNVDIVVELLDLNGNIKKVLDIPLQREINLILDSYGVFLIQYTFDDLVIKC